MPAAVPGAVLSTGVPGLDDVLGGGLAQGHVYLLEGHPGTGKTTLALDFLRAGAAIGERGLLIALSETEQELRAVALSHGWTLDPAIEIFELVPPESLLDPDQQQSLLYSADLELTETTRLILQAVERSQARRVVLDSLSEIRLLAQGSLRYRRQILAMKHHLARRGVTVLLLDDLTSEPQDRTLHSVVHGVIRLEEVPTRYGPGRRRLQVTKYRGCAFRAGQHDVTLRTGGVAVYPRLVANEHRIPMDRPMVGCGLAGLDRLLGGGLVQGSSTLLIGPAGTGKTMMTVQFAAAAIARGERAAIYLFDEEIGLFLLRSRALGFDLPAMREAGLLHVEQVDAAEFAPGEFAHRVRDIVGRGNVRTVVIDSLNGYCCAMLHEQPFVMHLHELLQFLNRQGASIFVTVAQQGLFGDMGAPVDVTYLADTVILLRYFEAAGEVRRAVSVIKNRAGPHEPTIREFRLTAQGIAFGEPLTQFQGVLRGIPVLHGAGPAPPGAAEG